MAIHYPAASPRRAAWAACLLSKAAGAVAWPFRSVRRAAAQPLPSRDRWSDCAERGQHDATLARRYGDRTER